MRWLKDVCQWNEERYRLVQISHEISRIWQSYADSMKQAHMPGVSRDVIMQLEAKIDSETRWLSDEYDRILTVRMLRSATKYGVPIKSASENSPHWQWSNYEGRLLLTSEGLAHFRREIAFERDLRHRPWVNWLGVAISVLSLVVATVALVR